MMVWYIIHQYFTYSHFCLLYKTTQLLYFVIQEINLLLTTSFIIYGFDNFYLFTIINLFILILECISLFLFFLQVIQYVINMMVVLMLIYVAMQYWSYRKIFTACYQSFASFDSRLESFLKCNTKLKQDIVTLCESGFFYTGK